MPHTIAYALALLTTSPHCMLLRCRLQQLLLVHLGLSHFRLLPLCLVALLIQGIVNWSSTNTSETWATRMLFTGSDPLHLLGGTILYSPALQVQPIPSCHISFSWPVWCSLMSGDQQTRETVALTWLKDINTQINSTTQIQNVSGVLTPIVGDCMHL